MNTSFMNKYEENNQEISALKEEYERLLNQPIPRRAKGISYGYLMFFFLAPAMCIGATLIGYIYIKYQNDLLTIFLIVVASLCLSTFTEQFLNLPRRTARNSFRIYPQLKKAKASLNEPGSRFLPNVPILKIDGVPLFILRYGVSNWWPTTHPKGELKGIAFLNQKGQFIENEELFKKAFMTMALTDICVQRAQQNFTQVRTYSTQALQKTLPRVEKILRRGAKTFEENNVGYAYQQMMDQLPSLYEAMKTGISIHDGEDKWRRALGWSFGLEFLYEDALEHEKMYQAYAALMSKAYGTQLVDISRRAVELLPTVRENNRWKNRQNVIWALRQLDAMPRAVQTWIFTFTVQGKPSPKDWELYRRKLDRAHAVQLQLVRE